jgi:NAD(P)-dependent dehydrogenase (short-subunit alcohol dehydrogenase family)
VTLPTDSSTANSTVDPVPARVIFITGANKGLGLEAARQLGRRGHTVLLGARDAAKGEAAAAALRAEGLDAHALVHDVGSDALTADVAAWIEARYGRLDTLVNNAGVAIEGFGTLTTAVPLEVWPRTFEANVFGVVRTTLALLPLLRRSAAGRIVNLSSILGSQALHADPASPIYHFKAPAYDASKAALNSLTIHLAYELRDTPIKVNAAHPGWVKTELGGDGAPMELPEGAQTTVALATLPADGPTGAFLHLGQPVPW